MSNRYRPNISVSIDAAGSLRTTSVILVHGLGRPLSHVMHPDTILRGWISGKWVAVRTHPARAATRTMAGISFRMSAQIWQSTITARQSSCLAKMDLMFSGQSGSSFVETAHQPILPFSHHSPSGVTMAYVL